MGFEHGAPLPAACDRLGSTVRRQSWRVISDETIIKSITGTYLLRFVWALYTISNHLSIGTHRLRCCCAYRNRRRARGANRDAIRRRARGRSCACGGLGGGLGGQPGHGEAWPHCPHCWHGHRGRQGGRGGGACACTVRAVRIVRESSCSGRGDGAGRGREVAVT